MPSREMRPTEVDIDQLRIQLQVIYDEYRTACMNFKYYAKRLTMLGRFNTAYEVTMALGASSTIAAWSLWRGGTGKEIWAIFGGFVGLLVVLKPFFQLHQKIEQLSKLHKAYRDLFYDLDHVVKQIRNTQSLTTQMKQMLQAADDRLRRVEDEDELNPSKRLLRRCQNEVNREIPARELWYPKYTVDCKTRG